MIPAVPKQQLPDQPATNDDQSQQQATRGEVRPAPPVLPRNQQQESARARQGRTSFMRQTEHPDSASASGSKAAPVASRSSSGPMSIRKKKAPASAVQQGFIEMRKRITAERNQLNPILQLRYPLPASQTLTAQLMEDSKNGIAADPRQQEPVTLFFSYGQHLTQLLAAGNQTAPFPSLLTHLGNIDIAPLHEFVFEKLWHAADPGLLRHQPPAVLINCIYQIKDPAKKQQALLRSIESFSLDGTRLMGLIEHIPVAADKDQAILHLARRQSAISVSGMNWPALLDQLDSRDYRQQICARFMQLGNEYQLFATLHNAAEQPARAYLDGLSEHAMGCFLLLENMGRIDASLQRSLLRQILTPAPDKLSQMHDLRLESIKCGAYRLLAPEEIDTLLEQSLSAEIPHFYLENCLLAIGHVSNQHQRMALFSRYEHAQQLMVQASLFKTALLFPPGQAMEYALPALERLLRQHGIAHHALPPALAALNQAPAALRTACIDQLLALHPVQQRGYLPELASALEDRHLREKIIRFCLAQHDPLLHFQAVCWGAEFARDASEEAAFCEHFQQGIARQFQFRPNGQNQAMLTLYFSRSEQRQNFLHMSANWRHAALTRAFVQHLLSMRGQAEYTPMLEQITHSQDSFLAASVIDEMATQIAHPSPEERAMVTHFHLSTAPFAAHNLGQMACSLTEFWNVNARKMALQTGFEVFTEALQEKRLAALLDSPTDGMPEFDLLCFVTRLIHLESRYDACHLYKLLASYQSFLSHAVKPEHCRKFAHAGHAPFEPDSMRSFLEQEKIRIMKMMAVFQNGIIFESFRRKKDKFSDILDKADRLFAHPDLVQHLHDVCHSKDIQKRSADDVSYTILTTSENYLQSGQKELLMQALRHFINSKKPNMERKKDFLRQYFVDQLAVWNMQCDVDVEHVDLSEVFDGDLLHLLGAVLRQDRSNLQEHEQERLKKVLNSALQGNFQEWIMSDPELGTANRNTANMFSQAFPANPAAFAMWTRPALATQFANDEGRRYSLSAGKEQPGKFIFTGNKVGMCTALDGAHPRAMLEALLFQMTQHLELKDELNETVGSVMMYFAKSEVHEHPVLMADYMAVHRSLNDDLVIRANMVQWLATFAQQVCGAPTSVFLGRTFNFISEAGLQQTGDIAMSVIGDSDNHMMYSNSLSNTDAWVDTRVVHTKRFYLLSGVASETA